MKCPKDSAELVRKTRHGVPAAECPNCKGLWIERGDFEKLEDEAFDLGDHAKGTMVFGTEPTDHPCPECDAPLRAFSYRLFDLELELCENEHGYWLDAGEDDRVLELMRVQEANVARSVQAEDRWTSLLNHLRSGSFLERMRDLFR